MKKYKVGTTFTVCGHDELIKKGWIHDHLLYKYKHKDFPGCSINEQMLTDYEGDIFTIKNKSHRPDWYYVEEEDYFIWPVATFLEGDKFLNILKHKCIEGMTPLDGWFICKTCGDNLREIK